jgi:hypothetical protein
MFDNSIYERDLNIKYSKPSAMRYSLETLFISSKYRLLNMVERTART